MGTAKTRGNGEGTIFKRKRNGKVMWVTELHFMTLQKNLLILLTK